METETSIQKVTGYVIGMLIATPVFVGLIVALTASYAWVEVKLWDWFAVPYLHLPHVSIWTMVGLSFLYGLFLPVPSTPKEVKNEWYVSFLKPLTALAAGYIIHTWVL